MGQNATWGSGKIENARLGASVLLCVCGIFGQVQHLLGVFTFLPPSSPRTALSWTARNFVFFLSSPPHFSFFLSCLGLSCETLAALGPPGFTRQPENSKRAHVAAEKESAKFLCPHPSEPHPLEPLLPPHTQMWLKNWPNAVKLGWSSHFWLWPEQSHIEARCWLNCWGALQVGFRAVSARGLELKGSGSGFGVRVFGVSGFRVEVLGFWPKSTAPFEL